jgi:hypothetical protein
MTEIDEVLKEGEIDLGVWLPSYAAFFRNKAEEFSRKHDVQAIPSKQFFDWVEEWAQGKQIARVPSTESAREPSRPPAFVRGLQTARSVATLEVCRII